jgi:HlyD family secretion protein
MPAIEPKSTRVEAVRRPFAISAALLAGVVAVSAPAAPIHAADAASTQASTPAQPTPPNITAIAAPLETIVETMIVSGNFVAREEIIVQPEIEGQAVQSIYVDVGDAVSEGQLLARLSANTINVSLAQMKANLARAEAGITQADATIAEAEANLTEANRALERTQQLRRTGVATSEQLDQRQAQARSAAARLEAARQSLAIATADRDALQAQERELVWRLEKTEIRAPAAGTIKERNIRVGAIASMAQQDGLLRIIRAGEIELDGEVPESQIGRLRVGQPVALRVNGSGAEIRGSVRLISPEVDTTTRLGSVRIALEAGARPPVGSFGRGFVEVGRSRGVSLPMTAVTFEPGRTYVQVIENGVVRETPVVTGLVGGGKVEIREGVVEGQLVVARAGTFVRDGDVINPIVQPAAAN